MTPVETMAREHGRKAAVAQYEETGELEFDRAAWLLSVEAGTVPEQHGVPPEHRREYCEAFAAAACTWHCVLSMTFCHTDYWQPTKGKET